MSPADGERNPTVWRARVRSNENAWALGADCGVDDLEWVTRANYLCNDLGLDAISAGVTIACAMEMSERGYISKRSRGGMEKQCAIW